LRICIITIAMTSVATIPFPSQLQITGGNVAADWKRFHSQWANYEVATDLDSKTAAKRAAVFLACIGTQAYEVFQSMDFATEGDRADIEKVIEAFERHCVGEVNITYERYVFNRRVQDVGETFESFLSDLRKLVRSCEYATLEESIIRDRIVIGIRDDATRRKLLQVRKLTLSSATDICRATEVATKQLRDMTTPDEVNALQHASHRSPTRSKQRTRYMAEPERTMQHRSHPRCDYCGRAHEPSKEACPAYGQTCGKCSRRHHFESVCKAKSARTTGRVQQLQDEALLTLTSADSKRLYSQLLVDDYPIRFLLDCGSTVNLLPTSVLHAIDRGSQRVRPPIAKLRMFDQTELQTAGMITASVQHPNTRRTVDMDFYITTNHAQPILGLNACLEFELLAIVDENICTVQTTPSPLAVHAVLEEYKDLFEGLGEMPGEVHLDVDPAVQPVQMPLRRLPIPIKDKVERELQQMCRDGIIEKVSGPTAWLSALLVVTKPNGNIRICMDPQRLNKALRRSHYRLPTIDDVLPLLTKAKVFSLVDAKNGFWLLKLDAQSSQLTCFGTHKGTYRWRRLPFGINCAPEIFQARIHEALEGLSGVACIADDILIFGSGDDLTTAQNDHDRNLIALLDRCREKGIKLNRDKLQLNRTATTFMGHELTSEGLHPDPKKIEAIRQMPAPTDRAGVMRLLGMATYVAKFCPNFSEVTAKIRELLPKDTEFCWDPSTHGAAFERLKDLLSSAPVLQYFNVQEPIIVQADASQSGLGAVLLQNGKPIEYASRAMSRIEQDSYAQIEKELLAVTFAVQRFHTYIYGTRITIQTDHLPLISIAKKALMSAPKRLQRMLLRLQSYDFDLVYIPGSQLIIPDTLSRAFVPHKSGQDSDRLEELAMLADEEQLQDLRLVASDSTINMIKAAAANDDQYQSLKQQIRNGWPPKTAQLPTDIREFHTFADELAISEDLVFKGQRVVIPRAVRPFILQRLHSSHIGVNGVIARAHEAVFYPGITRDLKELVSQCDICETYLRANQKEPLLPHTAPSRPWEKIGTDLFEFNGQNYLITGDYFSGFF